MTTFNMADAATREAILAVEARRQRALIDVDAVELDDLYEESLVHIHAPGLTHDKAQLIEHTLTRRAYVEMNRGDLNIRTAGDVAVMTGELVNRLRNPDGSERIVAGAVTQVLRRGDDGRWRFVSFQMTPYGTQVWGALPSETTEATSEQDNA
ncbi:YybH family protein [Paramicrobacterium chengjingii]|uniref:YybH family protein n=1 Tax=Paramicrobacterium chengjingii TaxID=2769067 RepID=UPI0014215C4E|nr:nuclear transport factor 2 family protein [Microbacterium chengjingii]